MDRQYFDAREDPLALRAVRHFLHPSEEGALSPHVAHFGFQALAGRPASLEKTTGQTLTELCSSRNSSTSRMVLPPRASGLPPRHSARRIGSQRPMWPVPFRWRRPSRLNKRTAKQQGPRHIPSLCLTKLSSGSLSATQVCAPHMHGVTSHLRQSANLDSTILMAPAEFPRLSVTLVSSLRRFPV